MTASPRLVQRRKADTESLWLITFADLMVQLMAFFALLFAFSASDQAKLRAALMSVKSALGVKSDAPATSLPGPPSTGLPDQNPTSRPGTPTGIPGVPSDRVADLEKLLTDLSTDSGRDVGVRMRVVTFRGSILFGAGSTQPADGSSILLDRIARLTLDYPGFTLVCEGHAAPGEKGGGGDALFLSSLRSQAVGRELIKRGMDPQRLAMEAHGDSKPEGDTSSPEGAALSRQVRFRFQRVAER